MADMGIPAEHIRKVCYENALTAYGQSGEMRETDWTNPPAIDQRQLYDGNSVLRGQKPVTNSKELSSLLIE